MPIKTGISKFQISPTAEIGRDFLGFPVVTSRVVERDKVYLVNGDLLVHPDTQRDIQWRVGYEKRWDDLTSLVQRVYLKAAADQLAAERRFLTLPDPKE